MVRKISRVTSTDVRKNCILPIKIDDQTIVEWEAYSSPHGLLRGDAAFNKTVLTHIFNYCSFHPIQWETYYLTGTAEEALQYSGFNRFISKYCIGDVKVTDFLKYLISKMENRYTEIEKGSAFNYLDLKNPLKNSLIVIDNPETFLFPSTRKNQTSYEALAYINTILRVGRAAGLHILFVSESQNVFNTVGGELRLNVTYMLEQNDYVKRSHIF